MMKPQITNTQLADAVRVLSASFRGKQVMAAFLTMLDAGLNGLDSEGQRAIMTVIEAQLTTFQGSTRQVVTDALHYKPAA